jgi:hypothetical protein
VRKYFIILLVLFTSCEFSFDPQTTSNQTSTTTEDISGTPTESSEEIYEESSLSELCLEDSCESEYDTVPDSYKNLYTDDVEACAFNEDPNRSSQFLLGNAEELGILMSKEDLFFMAWVNMRYGINPHFLMAVMVAESYGNCAAVSYAGAEGCFQITNYYGRLQLQQSYSERVSTWHWNEEASAYYADSIFLDSLTWFGEEPSHDQWRLTLDPTSDSVLGTSVSSVVNYPFGVIASGLYYHWQQHFLYYNYSSTRDVVEGLVQTYDDEMAYLMAGAYNAGIGALSNSLKNSGESYLNDLPDETQQYVERVTDYCEQYQEGAGYFSATYNEDEIDYIIDLISHTYDEGLDIEWNDIKTEVKSLFFNEQDELTLIDDVKALIYFISTYDPALAPAWAADINTN